MSNMYIDALGKELTERGVSWYRTYEDNLIVRRNGCYYECYPYGDRYGAGIDMNMIQVEHRKLLPEEVVEIICGSKVDGNTSDGYHTFNELYHHRAILFSVIVHDHKNLAWKAHKHADGTMYDGMFIVGIDTPVGQATYHYDLDHYWDIFDCKELEFAPEWDGHTPDQAIERIGSLVC